MHTEKLLNASFHRFRKILLKSYLVDYFYSSIILQEQYRNVFLAEGCSDSRYGDARRLAPETTLHRAQRSRDESHPRSYSQGILSF